MINFFSRVKNSGQSILFEFDLKNDFVVRIPSHSKKNAGAFDLSKIKSRNDFREWFSKDKLTAGVSITTSSRTLLPTVHQQCTCSDSLTA